MYPTRDKIITTIQLAFFAIFSLWIGIFLLAIATVIFGLMDGKQLKFLFTDFYRYVEISAPYAIPVFILVMLFWWKRPFQIGLTISIAGGLLAALLYLAKQHFLNAMAWQGKSSLTRDDFIGLHVVLPIWGMASGWVFGLFGRRITARYSRRAC